MNENSIEKNSVHLIEKEKIEERLDEKIKMEERFCKHLILTDFVNPTDSAIYAGISPEIAHIVSNDLLARPAVKDKLEELNPVVSFPYVLLQLRRIVTNCIEKNDDKSPIPYGVGLKAITILNEMLGYGKENKENKEALFYLNKIKKEIELCEKEDK